MWSENGYTLLTFSDVFSSAKETELCFWDGETLAKRSCTIQPGEFQVRILSKDGKRFYSGVDISTHCLSTRSLVIWDAENGAVLSRTKLDDVAVLYSALTLSRSEKFLAQAHFRSVEIGTVGKTYQRNFETHLPKGSTFIDFGSFSPDEKLAAIKNGKNGTEIYDTRTGELKRTLPLADIAPDLWAADGKVLIGYFCGQAKAWSAETGALLYRIKLVCKEHLDIVETVTDDEDRLSLHPDGKYLLSQSGTAVRIWDASSGELLQTVAAPGHEAEKLSKPKGDDYIKGRTARWSGDGKYFYVLAQDEHSVLQYEFTGK
jgi:WD40 repeat protein